MTTVVKLCWLRECVNIVLLMPQMRISVACHHPLGWLLLIGTALVVSSCGSTADPEAANGAPADGAATGDATSHTLPSGRLTVLAAASLTDTFEELAGVLAEEYPDLEIVLSFGPSSGLLEQAMAGAPADVLATANTATMDDAVEGGIVSGEPVLFARNTLTLAVPEGNPAGVSSLDDLARDDLRIALCEPQVPCGAASEQLLAAAGITAAPDTLENDVRDVTGKIALGEVDAGLIYLTDAAIMPADIDTVDVAEADEVVNEYPVAVLSDATNVEAAHAFVEALTTGPGQRALAEAGFLPPL